MSWLLQVQIERKLMKNIIDIYSMVEMLTLKKAYYVEPRTKELDDYIELGYKNAIIFFQKGLC